MSNHGDAARQDRCLNCGTPLSGPYCAQCGQRAGRRLVSLRRLVADAVEDQFSLNAALPRTFGLLLFLPGRLTTDYLRGRIARYLPPFRIYLICSFVFFLTFQLTDGGGAFFVQMDADDARPARAVADSALAEAPDSVMAALPDTVLQDSVATPDTASLRAAMDSLYRRFPVMPDRMQGRLTRRIMQLVGPEAEDRQAVSQLIRRELMARAPIAVFFLVPAYALLLAIAYVRQRRFYVEHFIFALHVHSFAFLMFTGVRIFNTQWPGVVLFLWLFIYLYLALLHVYGQGWFKTLIKYFVVGTLYSLLLLITIVIVAVLALLLAPM